MADKVVTREKLVGPIIRDEELAEALIAAIEKDNPGKEVIVNDHGGYVRIHTVQYCRVTRKSLEEALGRPFQLSQLEPAMSSFAGRIKVSDEETVWYLSKED